MSDIEWTDATWNPIVGCSRVSPGCENCYAERFVHRGLSDQHRGLTVLRKSGPGWTGEVRLVESALAKPLHWRKPRRVFVNSLSDLFHDALTNEQIAAVFGVMAACPHLTFQVLTKRPGRMRAWFAWLAAKSMEVHGDDGFGDLDPDAVRRASAYWHCVSLAVRLGAPRAGEMLRHQKTVSHASTWPLPNVWVGVTAEDQQRADERIPLLLDTPAAVRFVSYEPALGPVRFDRIGDDGEVGATYDALRGCMGSDHEHAGGPRIDWLIVGGESGPGARPMHPAWVRSIRDQCVAARVPFFFKQWGAWAETAPVAGGDLGGEIRDDRVRIVRRDREDDGHFRAGDVLMRRTHKKTNGRELDGRTWDEMPARVT